MRFPYLIMAIVMTGSLLAGNPTALAKHRYFATTGPVTNHLNRCLGIGWSDGYHAYGSRTAWSPWPAPPSYRPAPHTTAGVSYPTQWQPRYVPREVLLEPSGGQPTPAP
jgi:hypothetical protein